uniref:Uncharacterized protein n=1 Tax=uncultured marine microorganism HF4000_APKG10H12 TaxID=455560 RepID=B3TC87_9ZZZZ|nr:hypothetical protein ALOHA_HF4000APKG10H12ctg3g11 [uncultured marine microorganism HF4000_APKG10H12]
MPLQPDEPRLGRLGAEPPVELLGGQPERHVHQRPAAGLGSATIEPAPVDGVVEQPCFPPVACLHRPQPASIEQPPHDESTEVDREHRRCVVARAVGGRDRVAQRRGQRVRPTLGEVLADDRKGDTGRSQVLLCPAVDEPVPGHVDRAAEQIGRRVDHQRGGAHLGHHRPLRPDDRVVGRHVDIRATRGETQPVWRRHPCERLVLGRCADVHPSELRRLARRLLRPVAGQRVVGHAIRTEQIHRHHGELLAGAPLQEEDVVVVGHAGQGPQVRLCLLEDPVECRRPVADLEHRHADPWQRQQVALRRLEHRLRQHRRSGTEVEHAMGGSGGHSRALHLRRARGQPRSAKPSDFSCLLPLASLDIRSNA